ncbi:histidine phosphatase family protein [Variovorax sp. H27-G14]|uniref:histidine phosphatase family protein n=1 Tax=Variovorax sp. H27-G14 TaxID=3111914 RepID=UPI0038FC36B2
MKVIFVRHGESTGNAGVPSFDLSKLELTAAGHAQAAAVAASWEHRPDLIVLSPYLRTHLTAQPTIKRYPGVPVEVVPMEEFTYLEPSRWNGTSRAERLPHIEAFWETADPAYCDGPGAESFDTLLQRVDLTLQRLESLPANALVYAFSHGQFMQAVRVTLSHPTWTARQKMAHFWPFSAEFPVLNVDQVGVVYKAGVWRLLNVRADHPELSSASAQCLSDLREVTRQ